MPIKPHVPIQVTAQVPPDQIDSTVANIIGTLGGTDARTYEHAAAMYNSDFFKDESYEFKVALCKALKFYFSAYDNKFWSKAIS